MNAIELSTVGHTGTNACGDCVRPQSNEAIIIETRSPHFYKWWEQVTVYITLFVFVFKFDLLEATQMSLGLLFINYLLTSLITLLQLRTALKEIPSHQMFVGHNRKSLLDYQVIIGYFNKNNEFVIFKGYLTDYALKMLDAMHSPIDDIDLNFDNVRIKLRYISI